MSVMEEVWAAREREAVHKLRMSWCALWDTAIHATTYGLLVAFLGALAVMLRVVVHLLERV